MNCPRCHHDNPAGQKFCGQCGAPLVAPCPIKHDASREYSAVGVATHLAVRMEQLATPVSIRITAKTLRLAEGSLALREGPHLVTSSNVTMPRTALREHIGGGGKV